MALNPCLSIKDKEFNKFVESPTRPGEPAIEVVATIDVTNDIEVSTTPVIYNKSAPTANTEVSQLLTDGTKKFLIRVRGNANLQLAFTSTESGSKFISVPAGSSYSVEGLNLTSTTLYFQTDKNTQAVEVLEWS